LKLHTDRGSQNLALEKSAQPPYQSQRLHVGPRSDRFTNR
jgi:hypothetical protein